MVLYDRIMALRHRRDRRSDLDQMLYEAVDDRDFRQLIDALRLKKHSSLVGISYLTQHLRRLYQLVPGVDFMFLFASLKGFKTFVASSVPDQKVKNSL